ncbi:hypothetical protein G9A89_013952 [Geosiphon pyriformis]|nr:hypothetical protein G9A89_013952 [Geosiphon pyriformis]
MALNDMTMFLTALFSVVVDLIANFSSSNFKVLTTKVSGLKSKIMALEVLVKSVLERLNCMCSGLEDFQSPKSPIQQQESILTSTNLIDYLAENQSEKTKSEQETEDSENEEEMVSTYIAKIPDFSGEDIETSL